MCISKRFITNPFIHRQFLVSCGQCPACLQSKAIARTNRIRSECLGDGYVFMFVTLTYANDFCPFFDWSEYCASFNVHNDKFENDSLDGTYSEFVRVPIYRKKQVYKVRKSFSYDTNFVVKESDKGRFMLGVRDFSKDWIYKAVENPFSLKALKNQPNKNAIGVLYYPDLQNFIKRFRINLERRFWPSQYISNGVDFKFFAVGEYGPITNRPHFHLLIKIPKELYEITKVAVCSSWPYANRSRTLENISIAVNASAYVASYVNSDSSLPLLLRKQKGIRNKHTMSIGFGTSLAEFSLSSVVSKINSNDLRYDVQRVKDKCIIVERVPIPNYVINRYFPKFKGFSRLAPNEVFSVILDTSKMRYFAWRLNLRNDECDSIIRLLNRKSNLASSFGVSLSDFAYAYSRVWTVRSLNCLQDFYNSQIDDSLDNIPLFYDNISDLFNFQVHNDSLENLLEGGAIYDLDFNFNPKNYVKHCSLVSSYASYSKDKKIRNYCLSKYYDDF